jgi:hypothetical protein
LLSYLADRQALLVLDNCERLAEARSRHARYYSQWLHAMNEKLKGGEQLAALAALKV